MNDLAKGRGLASFLNKYKFTVYDRYRYLATLTFFGILFKLPQIFINSRPEVLMYHMGLVFAAPIIFFGLQFYLLWRKKLYLEKIGRYEIQKYCGNRGLSIWILFYPYIVQVYYSQDYWRGFWRKYKLGHQYYLIVLIILLPLLLLILASLVFWILGSFG